MKILTTILLFFVATLLLQAQDSISIKGKTIHGNEAQAGYWVFEDTVDTIVAVNYSEYKQMIDMLSKKVLKINQLDSIVKAKTELIVAFENYEKKADKHIVMQDSLLSYADSLYSGYKELYHKLKSMMNIKKFGVIVGAGINKYDLQNPGFLLDAGIEYNKIQMSYQFGKKYKGITIRYRVPIF